MRFWGLRVGMLIALLLAVSMLTFGAMNLLGDPLFNILGPIAGDTENPENLAKIEAAKEQFYLDRPLPERYVRWLGDFVTGDFGVRFSASGQPPVSEVIKERLPRTLALSGMAMTFTLAIGIPWACGRDQDRKRHEIACRPPWRSASYRCPTSPLRWSSTTWLVSASVGCPSGSTPVTRFGNACTNWSFRHCAWP